MPASALRAAALICAAALLGGCNIVVSKVPMFVQADTAGAPQIRPGLWVGEKDDCRYNEASAVDKWPDCAEPLMITATEFRDVGPKAKGQAAPYLLAAGDPLVLQARPDIDLSAGAAVSASGGGEASASAGVSTEGGPPPYVFLAVHPVAFDGQGRIVRMEQWPVMCGPPPPEPKSGATKPSDFVTRKPLPGLTIEGQVCTPANKAAVINAARASRAYSQVQTAHWVRDDPR